MYTIYLLSETEIVTEECHHMKLGLISTLILPSADSQEEAGIHQEQAFPQEGQETDQEIFIESPPPTEAHCGQEREREKKILNTKLFNKNKQQQ